MPQRGREIGLYVVDGSIKQDYQLPVNSRLRIVGYGSGKSFVAFGFFQMFIFAWHFYLPCVCKRLWRRRRCGQGRGPWQEQD